MMVLFYLKNNSFQVSRFFTNLDLALRKTLSASDDNRVKCEKLEKLCMEVNFLLFVGKFLTKLAPANSFSVQFSFMQSYFKMYCYSP